MILGVAQSAVTGYEKLKGPATACPGALATIEFSSGNRPLRGIAIGPAFAC